MSKILEYAKAVVGATVAGLMVLATSLDDDAVTSQEWVYVAIAFLGGFGVVAVTPNKKPSA